MKNCFDYATNRNGPLSLSRTRSLRPSFFRRASLCWRPTPDASTQTCRSTCPIRGPLSCAPHSSLSKQSQKFPAFFGRHARHETASPCLSEFARRLRSLFAAVATDHLAWTHAGLYAAIPLAGRTGHRGAFFRTRRVLRNHCHHSDHRPYRKHLRGRSYRIAVRTVAVDTPHVLPLYSPAANRPYRRHHAADSDVGGRRDG